MVTIGRSPSCDVVLRAPGVAPIHFFLEWVGSGDFDPSSGQWSIFDISESSSEQTGEGVILTDAPTTFRGFTVQCWEDRLAGEFEGGSIAESLSAEDSSASQDPAKKMSAYTVELVQARIDTGAVEEVLHLTPRHFLRKQRPLSKVREFELLWYPGQNSKDILQVISTELPGATVLRRGNPAQGEEAWNLAPGELLEVRWRGICFFLRLVQRGKMPKVPVDVFRNKLLLGLTLAGTFFGLSIAYVATRHSVPDQANTEPPPRIAKVEIQPREIQPPAPPAPAKPEPKPKPAPMKEVAETHRPAKAPAKADAAPVVNKAAPKKSAVAVAEPSKPHEAAAPKVKPNPGPAKSGLNIAAPPKDVNTLGLLGALKSSAGPKGAGIKADQIVNQGLITSSVSGDQGKVVLKSGAIGELGTGSGGSPHGRRGSTLSQASTTLSGNGAFNPKSTGPIAAPGSSELGDYAAGSRLGKGTGGAGTSNGTGSGGSLQVSGGLSREVVREIISRYRSQIRACYERSLIINPNLAGRILYRWEISGSGPVVTVEMVKSDVGFPKLESCVQDVIRSMKFPAADNGQPTLVIYPFAFHA